MTLYIANREWTVERKTPTAAELRVDGELRIGCCWITDGHIYISDSMERSMTREVVLHELTHALLASTQITNPEHYSEEDLCELCAKWASDLVSWADDVMQELFPEEPA